MPDIPVGGQIFDLTFHPSESLVFTGLLSGEIKAFSYDEQGQYESKLTVRPSKRSCRGLAISEDGGQLWAAGKGRALHTIDVATGTVTDTRLSAHDAAVNRVKRLLPHLLATGDDDGVIKLWDPRRKDAVRAYTHHFDFISDFLFIPQGKQLVSTSGDGTLSVIDIRSKKTEPLAQSEDQEDELLSIVSIKGGEKFAVGTQIGMLSIFAKRSGWGDCVDRIPGHPHSIDAVCNVPSAYPGADSTVLTGSSDGLLRVVQLLPTKLLGVAADHGEFPIERMAIDREGEGHWIASAGHEDFLKMTDLKDIFEDEDEDGDEEEEGGKESGSGNDSGSDNGDSDEDSDEEQGKEPVYQPRKADKDEDDEGEEKEETAAAEGDSDSDSSEEEVAVEQKNKKRKMEQDAIIAVQRKKGKNAIDAEPAFFDDL